MPDISTLKDIISEEAYVKLQNEIKSYTSDFISEKIQAAKNTGFTPFAIVPPLFLEHNKMSDDIYTRSFQTQKENFLSRPITNLKLLDILQESKNFGVVASAHFTCKLLFHPTQEEKVPYENKTYVRGYIIFIKLNDNVSSDVVEKHFTNDNFICQKIDISCIDDLYEDKAISIPAKKYSTIEGCNCNVEWLSENEAIKFNEIKIHSFSINNTNSIDKGMFIFTKAAFIRGQTHHLKMSVVLKPFITANVLLEKPKCIWKSNQKTNIFVVDAHGEIISNDLPISSGNLFDELISKVRFNVERCKNIVVIRLPRPIGQNDPEEYSKIKKLSRDVYASGSYMYYFFGYDAFASNEFAEAYHDNKNSMIINLFLQRENIEVISI